MAQDWAELGQRVMALAERLAAQVSTCRGEGEAAIIDLLADYMRTALGGPLAHGKAELHTVEFARPQVVNEEHGMGRAKALLAWLGPPSGVDTTRTLALMGHCDTVPGDGGLGRRSTPEWRHGRGWLDMKGGVAASVELFLAHARADSGASAVEPLPAHLCLLLTTDEEDSSLGVYALLPVLSELLARRGLRLGCVVNADYCEPAAGRRPRRRRSGALPLAPAEPENGIGGVVYAGAAGKLLLGISSFGQPAHACAAGSGVNAGALAGHIAAGLEDLPSLAVQAGAQRLPPPRVLMQDWERAAYDVTTVAAASTCVNLLHDGRDLPRLWRRCLRAVRELARSYQTQQRRRMLAWAQRAHGAELPPAPPRALVTDYAALANAAEAAGIGTLLQAPGEGDEPRRARLAHVARLVGEIRARGEVTAAPPLAREIASGRPLLVLSLLPPFYPGGGMPPGDAQRSALQRAAQAHGAALLPLYPNISDLSAFCWNAGNLALAAQAPLFHPPAQTAAWAPLAVPVCNVGPIGYGAHTADERVYVPYLRDTLPRLLDSALRELASAG